jgi:hypothetical protein
MDNFKENDKVFTFYNDKLTEGIFERYMKNDKLKINCSGSEG